MSVPSDNFYCNKKFTWLSVNLEKKLISSCSDAFPARIDLTWLRANPGRIFNTPWLQQERLDMLNHRPAKSCETACWIPERNNLVSLRLLENGTIPSHTDIEATPEFLNVVFGSTCNLTCSYCCKQFSSAWLQDIKQNGPYLDQDRFKITNIDRVVSSLSQNEIRESENFNLLTDELSKLNGVKKIRIGGGEPFLYNGLVAFLDRFPTAELISINTGLGVNHSRFCRELDKIKTTSNLELNVSAENISQLYEFNRYNNSYENFVNNLTAIQERNIKITFNSVLSNLTIFGLPDFVEQYGQYLIHYVPCLDPDFLAPNVLDSESKEFVINQIKNSNISIKDQLITSIVTDCTDEQRQNLSAYLKQYAQRRNLDLAIFPKSMLQWIGV